MPAYYNEIDPHAAQWLRKLIADGHIAPGDVDERSIVEVRPDDLRGYEQCHFFAGIGGWSLALRLAGWPDHRPVWSGSCPCQPFSSAGNKKGKADERHLFPVWFRLIKAVQPAIIFGEQVASAIGHGWLDDVAEDLESVRFTDNRENMYRMQDPETFDRVSEILWSVKRGRSPSLQSLPAGIREEVAQFIGRIQGSAKEKAQGSRQSLSARMDMPQQGNLFGIGVPQAVREEGDSIQPDKIYPSAIRTHQQGGVRSEWVPAGQHPISGEEVQRPVTRQDRPEEGIRLRECADSGLCGERSNGGLGRRCFQTNHEKVDGEINVGQEPCAAKKTGIQPQTGFTHGWLDDVYQGLEGEGYAVGAADLPACGAGAPHRRQRLFWVANAKSKRGCWRESRPDGTTKLGRSGETDWMANSHRSEQQTRDRITRTKRQEDVGCLGAHGLMGNPYITGLEGRSNDTPEYSSQRAVRPSSPWGQLEWLTCSDGKSRPSQPGIFPLVDGIPKGLVRGGDRSMAPDANQSAEARTMRLKGYGNAIVPQVAALFITAAM